MRPANDFKRWLELNYKADFGDEVLRTACRSLDAVPEEFEQLVAVLDNAADDRQAHEAVLLTR